MWVGQWVSTTVEALEREQGIVGLWEGGLGREITFEMSINRLTNKKLQDQEGKGQKLRNFKKSSHPNTKAQTLKTGKYR